MKKLKILIIILVIIVISIGGTLLFLMNKNKDSNDKVLTPEDKVGYKIEPISDAEPDIDIKENFKIIENVEDNATYYTIKAIADRYIMSIASEDKEILKNIIAPTFIKKYNITDNNILKIASIPKISRDFHVTYITDLKKISASSNIQVFFITGKGRTFNASEKFQFSLMIELDIEKKLYYIYPEKFMKDNGYSSLKVGDKINNFNVDDITNMENNAFIYTEGKNDKEMSIQYMYNFKDLLIYYKDDAYEKLDTEYREKRFTNKEDYYNYLDENKIMVALMSSEQYKVVKNENYTDYIISDKYKNVYRFRQKADNILDYTVFLDNYTIVSKEDEKKYEDSNKTTKAKLNLNKIIAMINTKDYKAIYKCLNNDFRNNNFNSINDLRKYITNNFYEINSIKLENTNDQDNYIAFTCKLINQRNTSESKSVNIIIGKTDNIDFEMSFSFE